MPQFQIGQLPADAVGRERGQPVPVDIGEPQLRTRVRALRPDDDPHPFRPPVQVDDAGQFSDPRAVPLSTVTVIGRGPGLFRERVDRRGGALTQPETHRVRQALIGEPPHELMRPTGPVGADQHLPTKPTGSIGW